MKANIQITTTEQKAHNLSTALKPTWTTAGESLEAQMIVLRAVVRSLQHFEQHAKPYQVVRDRLRTLEESTDQMAEILSEISSERVYWRDIVLTHGVGAKGRKAKEYRLLLEALNKADKLVDSLMAVEETRPGVRHFNWAFVAEEIAASAFLAVDYTFGADSEQGIYWTRKKANLQRKIADLILINAQELEGKALKYEAENERCAVEKAALREATEVCWQQLIAQLKGWKHQNTFSPTKAVFQHPDANKPAISMVLGVELFLTEGTERPETNPTVVDPTTYDQVIVDAIWRHCYATSLKGLPSQTAEYTGNIKVRSGWLAIPLAEGHAFIKGLSASLSAEEWATKDEAQSDE